MVDKVFEAKKKPSEGQHEGLLAFCLWIKILTDAMFSQAHNEENYNYLMKIGYRVSL